MVEENTYYIDLKNGIYETTEYLELFLRNLLLDEKNELHNRSMHIKLMGQRYKLSKGETTEYERPRPGRKK